MEDAEFSVSVRCPWCGKGVTLADRPAEINVSCQCCRCGNYYRINFKSLRALKAKPSLRTATEKHK